MSRPCYSAVNQHATRGRPALVFVPTRKHARLVALDLLTFAASDADPHRFRLAEAKDVEPFLARVSGGGGGAAGLSCDATHADTGP